MVVDLLRISGTKRLGNSFLKVQYLRKGTFTEQLILEQMVATLGKTIYYYDDESSKLELDFLIQKDDTLFPIEVKAEENGKTSTVTVKEDKESGFKVYSVS